MASTLTCTPPRCRAAGGATAGAPTARAGPARAHFALRTPALARGTPILPEPAAARPGRQQALSPRTAAGRAALVRAQAAATEAPPTARASAAGNGKGGHTSPDDVVIVAAVRTPLCKAKVGGLKETRAEDLMTAVLRELVKRSGIDPAEVGDICFGSGLPAHAYREQCAAGLQSIADVAANIKAGYFDIGIAGGVESMSTVPLQWEGSDNPKLAENQFAADCNVPMGITSDNVAERFGVPREKQDSLAVASHEKAAKAQAEGRFKDEIVPVEATVKDPNTGEESYTTVDKDDGIRADYTMQKLSKLRACFKKGGTTTVGNACQVTDGAAAVLLMKRSEAERRGLPVMAALRSFAVVGVEPAVMGVGPAHAVPKALEKAGLSKDDVDIYEINEAFGSQAAYCVDELGLPMEKVNPNGGGIALGHPIGCTGARQTVTLMHEMKRRNGNGQGAKYGVVSMCTGSGMGAAAVFEAGDNGKQA